MLRLTAALALLSTASTQAAALAVYTFGTDGSLDRNVTSTLGGITSTTLTAGWIDTGLSGATFGESGANALWLSRSAAALATSLEAAVSSNRYLSFDLTPGAGESITIESLSLYANTVNNPNFVADTVTLQINTGSGWITHGTEVITARGGATPGQLLSYTLDTPLTGLTSPVNLRLLFYNTTGNEAGNWTEWTRIDDITVHGTLIPEPSSLLFLTSASIGCLALRKRRHP